MTNDSPRNLDFPFGTHVQFLQGTIQPILHGRGITGKQFGEDITSIPEFERFIMVAIEIVDLTLPRIAKNIVSFRDLLELGFGFNPVVTRVLVGMPSDGQSLVRLLQLFVIGIPIHSE